MTIAPYGTNRDIAIGNATSYELIGSNATYDAGAEDKQFVRFIHCITAGTVTLTGQNEPGSDTVDISMNAGDQILWGSHRVIATDSTFTGIIGG